MRNKGNGAMTTELKRKRRGQRGMKIMLRINDCDFSSLKSTELHLVHYTKDRGNDP